MDVVPAIVKLLAPEGLFDGPAIYVLAFYSISSCASWGACV